MPSVRPSFRQLRVLLHLNGSAAIIASPQGSLLAQPNNTLPFTPVSEALVAGMVASGWIATDPDDPSYRLTSAGRDMLRALFGGDPVVLSTTQYIRDQRDDEGDRAVAARRAESSFSYRDMQMLAMALRELDGLSERIMPPATRDALRDRLLRDLGGMPPPQEEMFVIDPCDLPLVDWAFEQAEVEISHRLRQALNRQMQRATGHWIGALGDSVIAHGTLLEMCAAQRGFGQPLQIRDGAACPLCAAPETGVRRLMLVDLEDAA